MRLEAILREHYRPAHVLGWRLDGEALMHDLRAHRSRCRIFIRSTMVLSCAALVLAGIATRDWIGLPGASGVAGVAALIAAGAAFLTFRLGNEWARTDLLIILLASGDEQLIGQVVQVLLDKALR